MVRTISICAFAIAVGGTALAALPTGRHRIELTNGAEVATMDAPAQEGSVLIFHRASDGRLDGVPAEMVARIEAAGEAPRLHGAATAVSARAPGEELEPGEVVDLGTTDDAYVTPRADTSGGGASAAAAPQTPMWNGFYYGIGIGGGPAQTPVNTLLTSVPSSTDLALASGTSTPALVGSNGFPVVPGTPVTVIGPDGTPTISPTAAALVIGPNGTPILDPNAPSLAVASNGTPILAPAGTPGSVPLTIGSNGTPILAPAGTPGSVPLTIGSNGTPILAPAGSPGSVPLAIDANGTPVLAPTFAAGGAAMTFSGAPVTGAAPAMAAPAAARAAVVGHR
ncbi:MAG TPA: hypothetical protein VMQ61_03000 [Thermoanaerobaculia bacterium]|nr:hypothetical protein [Thermoanaerobaculia bacterium]